MLKQSLKRPEFRCAINGYLFDHACEFILLKKEGLRHWRDLVGALTNINI